MEIRWLGHSAFALTHDGTTGLVDPWLTGNPKAAASAAWPTVRLPAWSVIVQGTPISRRVSLTRACSAAGRQADRPMTRTSNAAFPRAWR